MFCHGFLLPAKLQENKRQSNDNGVEAGCAGEEGGADGDKNITGPVTHAKPPDPSDIRVNSGKFNYIIFTSNNCLYEYKQK